MRTVGVEEEYLLVDDEGVPVAVAPAALALGGDPVPVGGIDELPAGSRDDEPAEEIPGGELEAELKQQQLETSTPPCHDLESLAAELREGRARAGRAAGRAGAHAVAVATSPLPFDSTVTPDRRYRRMTALFGLTAREQLTCGCHVHVAVDSPDEGVLAIDRIGVWLPVLLALSANSPFWNGEESHYASYRHQVWNRWPSAGPTQPFGTASAYREAVDALVATGTILDEGMVYFDARLSARYPTVEIRVADVCLDLEDAVLVAALARALVETAVNDALDGVPAPDVRTELRRAAAWRASRSGVRAELLSPTTFLPVPAADAVAELVEHTRDALEAAGDLERVAARLERVLSEGTGADTQRRWRAEGLEGLVEKAALRTFA
ncbi:glutamate--cysteine ligase [Luteimicrobium sp. NPDC057192]|uniref:glutamate--cysteine ligase n=1 Tax=Luteimicrobium sp. NPDC057192 TaxID=3346042 RepID=UPI00363B96B9